jgi:hypothetical protein
MAINFEYFLSVRDTVGWEQVREWRKGQGAVSHMIWKGKRFINGRYEETPAFFLYVSVDKESNAVKVSLAANVTFTMNGAGQKVIDSSVVGSLECLQDGTLDSFVRERYGMGNQIKQYHKAGKTMINSLNGLIKTIYLNEVTNRKDGKFHTVRIITVDMNTGKMIPQGGDVSNSYPSIKEGSEAYVSEIEKLSSNGYQPIEQYSGKLPDGIDHVNKTIFSQEARDYIMENYTKRMVDKALDIMETGSEDDYSGFDPSGDMIKSSPTKTAQTNQWYSGNIPDPSQLQQYVGSGSVDASQIASVFSGSADAISLVNQFDPSLLRNVAFIFNTSGGAFGVYVPALDVKIKNEEAKTMMKNLGYRIEPNQDGGFSAYPQSNDVPQDKVKADMDQVYSRLKMQGGNTFGVNMQKVMQASQQDCRESNLTDQDDIRMLTILHLGGTMVHEAVHALGSTSEGPSEQAEMKFMEWALQRLNEQRRQKWEQKNPGQPYRSLMIDTSTTRSASAEGWYRKALYTAATMERTAQYGAQFAALTQNTDPTGRMNWPSLGRGDETGPIDAMLANVRHEDHAEGVIPVEKKMRLVQKVKWDNRPDPLEHTEDLLQKDRDEFQGYRSTEKLMEDKRTKPLMLPVNASSAQIVRTASIFGGYNSLFGWQNNLDLPMRERIIPREEADDFTNFNWGGEGCDFPGSQDDSAGSGGTVANQPRYNPSYDDNGFYQKIIDFQMSEPDKWDDYENEHPGLKTSPWHRMASSRVEDSQQEVINALKNARLLINEGMIRATRFIASDDLLDHVCGFYGKDKDIGCKILKPIGKHGKYKIHPVWVYKSDATESEIAAAEEWASGKDKGDKAKKAFNTLCGDDILHRSAIEKLINLASSTCSRYGVDDLYIVGGYPRALVMKEEVSDVRDLDFSAAWPEQTLKVGGLMATAVGVKNVDWYHRTMTMSWEWLGVKCDFRGDYVPVEVRDIMRLKGIRTTPLNMDVYNRDFTMNMLVYSLKDRKVYDVCGNSMKDIKDKVVRTFFDPSIIVKRNPLSILRAIKFAVRYGFSIDDPLARAIKENSHILFGSTISTERLMAGVGDVLSEGRDEAERIIREFGMVRLLEMTDKKDKED